MSIKLYYWGHSSATRVLWALEELGVPFERCRVDHHADEHKKADYLAINPNGKVPALQIDGVTMVESAAILIHLGERFGVEKGMWPKPGSGLSAQALSWVVWGSINLIPLATEHARHTSDWFGTGPNPLPKEQRNATVAAECKQAFERNVSILDRHLAGRDYILGNEFTLVDIANALICAIAPTLGVSVSHCRNVEAWAGRCCSRAAGAAAMQEM